MDSLNYLVGDFGDLQLLYFGEAAYGRSQISIARH
jgi:hypothetical protein